ncbi:hypothetical protein N7481_010217 [Penicillium waksmanii]|uniref:uncharacterized protein n=1 Tax=Penicillium waksmanii TaxID=69791 RepID=UPI0025487439|nr:uncharacterized protein N7481_010217 [Penicillium waksmanii]KAJ5976510.1 hypothetical protein N7481_010217 [Penicillium waksmanii]
MTHILIGIGGIPALSHSGSEACLRMGIAKKGIVSVGIGALFHSRRYSCQCKTNSEKGLASARATFVGTEIYFHADFTSRPLNALWIKILGPPGYFAAHSPKGQVAIQPIGYLSHVALTLQYDTWNCSQAAVT